jgi:hypothetical protein
MTAVEVIRDALARVVWIREGRDRDECAQALKALELDLAGWLTANEKRTA